MAECDSKSSETQIQYEKSDKEYSNRGTTTGNLEETSTKLTSCLSEDVNNAQLNDPCVREKFSPIGVSSAMEADSSVMSSSGQRKEFDQYFLMRQHA